MNGLYLQYQKPWKVQYEKMGKKVNVLHVVDQNH